MKKYCEVKDNGKEVNLGKCAKAKNKSEARRKLKSSKNTIIAEVVNDT